MPCRNKADSRISCGPTRAPAPARSLSAVERATVLTVLHEERFQDRSPAAIQATLLDEGQYLCSSRTIHTDRGVTGIGETYNRGEVQAAMKHWVRDIEVKVMRHDGPPSNPRSGR
jgi:hypothetical protein